MRLRYPASITFLLSIGGLTIGCGGERPRATACGIAALAGPTMLLSEFGVPGQALAAPPRQLPEQMVARMAAGPAYRTVVGRVDTIWVVGVEGTIDAEDMPGFGALVLDQSANALGVMLYAGDPLEGAPILGQVSIGNNMIPLIGIKLDPARFQDPACPFFPDSLLL